MLDVLAKSALWLGLFATGMMCYRIVSGKYYVAPGDTAAYWPFVVFVALAAILTLSWQKRG